MNELKQLLLGENDTVFYFAAFIFILIGTLITILFDAYARNKDSKRTPANWNWKFYWHDNAFRLSLNLLMAIMVIRFWKDITGLQLTMLYCFLLGLGIDGMYIVFKRLRKKINNQIEKF